MEDFPSSRYQVWLKDHHRSPLFDQVWKITISKGLKDPKGSKGHWSWVIFQFPWLATTCNGQICCQICWSAIGLDNFAAQDLSRIGLDGWRLTARGWDSVRHRASRLPYVCPMGRARGRDHPSLWSMVFKMVEDFVPRSGQAFSSGMTALIQQGWKIIVYQSLSWLTFHWVNDWMYWILMNFWVVREPGSRPIHDPSDSGGHHLECWAHRNFLQTYRNPQPETPEIEEHPTVAQYL